MIISNLKFGYLAMVLESGLAYFHRTSREFGLVLGLQARVHCLSFQYYSGEAAVQERRHAKNTMVSPEH